MAEQNVVLCGFMGCGKTTVGKRLAALTGAEFVDMDEYIEQQAGMTVSAIFEQFGDLDLFGGVQLTAGDLLTIAERGVENVQSLTHN